MALTIGNWLLVLILFVLGAGCCVLVGYYESTEAGFISFGVVFVICVSLIIGFSWWHNNTESGKRDMKEYHSDIGGGLERTIVITSEDGREIFRYEGKVDVEIKHEGNANYILFESEDGLRYIIYYGITDTMTIIEKEP